MAVPKSKRGPQQNANVNPDRRVIADRSAIRALVRLPARITVASERGDRVAFVRDISPKGMFFYSNFTVPVGESLSLRLEYSNGAKQVRLELSGKVVRVERGASPEAVGIAILFDSVHNEVPRTPIPPKKPY